MSRWIACFCTAEAGEDVQHGGFLFTAHFSHHGPLMFEDLSFGEDFGDAVFVDAVAERHMEGTDWRAIVEEAGQHKYVSLMSLTC